MQLKENHKLKGGKYSVVRVLGQGGFGITYLALDTSFGLPVAIKEFFPHDYCGRRADGRISMGSSHTALIVEILRRRFYKEASNLSRLDHPNIVRIHEVFDENDTTYIVMDFIEGDTLQTIVRDQGPLSEPKASKYIHGVGAALEYIHSQNVTHFDVKPSNIIVRRFDDRPILIDFGFSKEYNGPGDENTKTPPAVSPGYSAMELYNSATFVPFSPQSDIYSLGATLFYLLVGQAPPSPGEILEYGYNLPDAISSDMRAAIDTALKIPRSQRTDKVSDILALLPAPEKDHNSSIGNSNFNWFVYNRIIELEIENKELRRRLESALEFRKKEYNYGEKTSVIKKGMLWLVFLWIILLLISVICVSAVSKCTGSENTQQSVNTQPIRPIPTPGKAIQMPKIPEPVPQKPSQVDGEKPSSPGTSSSDKKDEKIWVDYPRDAIAD